MKKNIRRLFVFVSCLLLCAISVLCCVGCASTPPEDPEVTAVKAVWNEVVVNREKEVRMITMTQGPLSSHITAISEQETIDSFLDVCQTLDLSLLKTEQTPRDPDASSTEWDSDIIGIAITLEDSSVRLSLGISRDGQGSLSVYMGDQESHAYIDGWQAYDAIEEYRPYNQFPDSLGE